jgi:hypothetical protein
LPSDPRTPLSAGGFDRALRAAGLERRYPVLVSGIRSGFLVGFRAIGRIHTPPNAASIHDDPAIFSALIDTEFAAGRWIGPFTASELLRVIGPFHSSPCSLVDKPADPHRPGAPRKKRLIQNFSFPHTPRDGISSINAGIAIEDFPCTWGTPEAVGRTIWSLPPGSEIAIRDVASAYRNVPLHPSQWPAAVVRIGDDAFAADVCGAFGAKSIGGVWGSVADASCDIMRHRGLGPLTKWVDDFIFFRIRREHLRAYNDSRARQRADVIAGGGEPRQKRGNIWWEGTDAGSGPERFTEDLAYPLRALATGAGDDPADAEFAYSMRDIDSISSELGLIWGAGKTRAFAAENPYMGFGWDVQSKVVSITEEKRRKYLAYIRQWRESGPTHVLDEAQALHGRLQHICYIIPRGRAYLTALQATIYLSRSHAFLTYYAEIYWSLRQRRTSRREAHASPSRH